MENKHINRLKTIFIFVVFIVSTAALLLAYNCASGSCGKTVSRDISVYLPRRKHSKQHRAGNHLSFLSHPIHEKNSRVIDGKFRPAIDDYSKSDFQFDINGRDVIVFLHIPKTGGNVFGHHLINDLILQRPCDCDSLKKHCKCERPRSKHSFWLFSQESFSWKCGTFADWTELTSCVDKVLDEEEKKISKRRYFYATLLRNPIERFLSEYRYIKSGKKWRDTYYSCNGERWILPSCMEKNRKNMKIHKFLNCPQNLAINRQTRMLADLTLVGCYNNKKLTQEEYDTLLLASAKNNLRKMAFIGLAEYQLKSQIMFEKTFDLHFASTFKQRNKTVGSRVLHRLSDEVIEEVKKVNYLDIELYKYAENLFHSRYNSLKSNFPDVEVARQFKFLPSLITDEDQEPIID